MLVAETCLLLAVRNALRTAMSLADKQCDIELDDQVPALASDTYVTVVGAGTSPGERHSSSGGVWDMRMNVRVTVYSRMGEVARDRRRNLFIDRLTGLNKLVDTAISTIDYSYAVTAAAKVLLEDTTAEGGEYPEPFRSFTIDTNPRPVYKDYDAAPMSQQMADPVIALARGVTFQRARFMKERA